MGHLVNACGFRLGWTTIWSNYWGTQLKFGYSKFIFICARLRAFLRYYFYSKAMDKSRFLFSHFEIVKLLKHLYIKIYFYSYRFFRIFSALYNRAYKRINKWRKSFYKRYKRRLLSSFMKESVKKNNNIKNLTLIRKKIFNSFYNSKYFLNNIYRGKFDNKLNNKSLINLKNINIKLINKKLNNYYFNTKRQISSIKKFELKTYNYIAIIRLIYKFYCKFYYYYNLFVFKNLQELKKRKVSWENKKIWYKNKKILNNKKFWLNLKFTHENGIFQNYVMFVKYYKKFIVFYNKMSKNDLKFYKYNNKFLKYMKKFSKNVKFLKYINIFYDYIKKINVSLRLKSNLKVKKVNKISQSYNWLILSNQFNLIYEFGELKSLNRKHLLFNIKQSNLTKFHSKKFINKFFQSEISNKYNLFKYLQRYKYLKLINIPHLVNIPSNTGIQYPKSFFGCWWDELNYFNKIDFDKTEESIFSNPIELPQWNDCLWLYFKEGQRDISILKNVSWLKIFESSFYLKYIKQDDILDKKYEEIFESHPKLMTLLYLLYFLNTCERQLVAVAFNKRSEPKFNLNDLYFIDAILDNLYDRLCLSLEQRNLRKASLTINELIVAMLFAFKTQRKRFLVFYVSPIRWRSLMPLNCLSLIDKIFYDFWINYKYVLKMPKLINLYGEFSNIKWNKFNCGVSKKLHLRLYKKYKRLFPRRKLAYRKKKNCYSYAALLILLNICGGYRKSTLFDMRYFNVLLKALKSGKIFLLKKFFLLRWRSTGYSFLRTNMRYYFILSSIFLWNNIDDKMKKKTNKRGLGKFFSQRIFGVLHDLIFIKILKPLADCFKLTLVESFKSSVLPLIDYTVQFFLITNSQVNAIFLSRFVAKSLANRHRLRSFLYPLKREFRAVGREMKITSKKILKFKNFFWKRQMKVIWRLILLIIILTYEKYLKFYYNYTSLKISLDLFSLMIWLNKKIFFLFNWNKLNSSFLGLNKKLSVLNKLLFERRALFLVSFIQDTKLQIFTFSKYFKEINLGGFSLFNKWDLILSFLIQDFVITKYSLLSKNFWILNNFEIIYLKFGAFQYKRFLNFNYNALSYSLFTNYNKTNNLKNRLKTRKPLHSGFLGFKMRCSGRFSRRQRASSYWFSLGSVPLNSVNAFIEYASYTVTLVNSAITIKVWVHKSKNVDVLYEIPFF